MRMEIFRRDAPQESRIKMIGSLFFMEPSAAGWNDCTMDQNRKSKTPI